MWRISDMWRILDFLLYLKRGLQGKDSSDEIVNFLTTQPIKPPIRLAFL